MTYYYLYVILDIFSRYVVGWTLDLCESAQQAARLIAETSEKQSILPNQLTIHADRGASMKSNLVAGLMTRLGITRSHSRPRVSNDNPFSESQFKTLKYRPEFPDRFGSFEDALQFCRHFFDWYNNHHRHSAIGLHTPHSVHYRLVDQIDAVRRKTLLGAFESHPERFVNGIPRLPVLPEAVWINPPKSSGHPPETAALS
jgi:putative transposase